MEDTDPDFVAVARVSDLPPVGGLEVTVQGRRIAIFKTSAGYFATEAECPHKGGPLAAGWAENETLFCPLHGWEFDLRTGICQNARRPIECYLVKEIDGEIRIRI